MKKNFYHLTLNLISNSERKSNYYKIFKNQNEQQNVNQYQMRSNRKNARWLITFL